MFEKLRICESEKTSTIGKLMESCLDILFVYFILDDDGGGGGGGGSALFHYFKT